MKESGFRGKNNEKFRSIHHKTNRHESDFGHYVKFPFMYSDVAASEMRSGLEAYISLTSFT